MIKYILSFILRVNDLKDIVILMIIMSRKENDIKFGTEQEIKLFDTLKTYFNSKSLKPSKNKYALFDYESKSQMIELKSRYCCKDTYSTTIVGLNKIEYARNSDKKCYICFNFEDGLYYIKFNEKQFDNFAIKTISRKDRGCVENAKYVLIPVNLLTKIEFTES